jgi:hypothetical protein
MSFIQDKALLIIGVLLVLIVIEGLIIYVQYKNRSKSRKKSKGGSSGSIYKEKYEKTREEREELRSKVDQLNKAYKKKEKECADLTVKYQRNKDDYGKVIIENQQLSLALENIKVENVGLERKVGELTRKNAELNKLLENAPTPNETEAASTVSQIPIITESKSKSEPSDKVSPNSSMPITEDVSTAVAEQEQKTSKEEQTNESSKEESKEEVPKDDPKVETQKEKVMYASFPRSAGSSNYFSDLSENLADDSFFELRISIASGKATFKPLDFMKIRNYDPAMSAMLTEGVKPNVASAVVGIEPGKAHVEGKDWIIDNLAKIKLA